VVAVRPVLGRVRLEDLVSSSLPNHG
jgi:hypothetical protein